MIAANFDSPLGPIVLRAGAAGLTHCGFADAPHTAIARGGREGAAGCGGRSGRRGAEGGGAAGRGHGDSAAARRHLAAARSALAAYFGGARDPWAGLALAPAGTPFQRRVWDALRGIPWGAAIAYGELARRLGDARAARAVGAANARNPLAVIVPCHRVIAANGLGGYAAGLARKRRLLAHEGARLC